MPPASFVRLCSVSRVLSKNRIHDSCADGQFECAFGFVGSGGVCVPYTGKGGGEKCGTDGKPVCTGDALIGTNA